MKRLNSLKGRKLFKEVYRRGIKIQEKGLRLVVLEVESYEDIRDKTPAVNRKIRIGISVNKNFGKAVIRNRIKRKIRSICDEMLNEMNNRFYVIIWPMNETLNLNHSELRSNFCSAFKRAGIIDNEANI